MSGIHRAYLAMSFRWTLGENNDPETHEREGGHREVECLRCQIVSNSVRKCFAGYSTLRKGVNNDIAPFGIRDQVV